MFAKPNSALEPSRVDLPGLEDQGADAPSGGLGTYGSALPRQICGPFGWHSSIEGFPDPECLTANFVTPFGHDDTVGLLTVTPAGELVRGLPTSRVDRYPLFRVEGPVPGLLSRGCPDELGKNRRR